MRWPFPLLLALLLAGLAFPALAADGNKIGYVSFREVSLSLHDRNARVDIDYTLDPGMDLVVIIFGAGDLEKKLERSLNFPMLRIEDVGSPTPSSLPMTWPWTTGAGPTGSPPTASGSPSPSWR